MEQKEFFKLLADVLKLFAVALLTIGLGPSLNLLKIEDGAIKKPIKIKNDSTAIQEIYFTDNYTQPIRIKVTSNDTNSVCFDTVFDMTLSNGDKSFELPQAPSDTGFKKDELSYDVSGVSKGLYELAIPIKCKKQIKDIDDFLVSDFNVNKPNKENSKDIVYPKKYRWYHFYYFNQIFVYVFIVTFFVMLLFVLPRFLKK